MQRTFTSGYDLISLNTVTGSTTTPHFTGADGLGTVRLLTDQVGTVTDRYEYEAFGSLLHRTGSTPNPYQFTGEQYDPNLNLYSLRARWYNQGTGRFLTMDTYPINVQDPVELNRYGYTANNPVNAVDPSGLVMARRAALTKTISIPAIAKLITLGLAAYCAKSVIESFIGETYAAIILGGTVKLDATTPPCQFQRQPATCATKYPNHRECSEFPPKYVFWGTENLTAFDFAKAWLESPDVGYSNVTSSRPRNVKTGMCGRMTYNPDLGTEVASSKHVGRHYDLHAGNRYIGSATVCECCQEVNSQPVLMTRCKIDFEPPQGTDFSEYDSLLDKYNKLIP